MAAAGEEKTEAGAPAPAPAFDDKLKSAVQKLKLLTKRAGPRDGDDWKARLKEEYTTLIQYIKICKESDNDWFKIASDKTGVNWSGKCWYYYNGVKYEFKLEFEIPVAYPTTNPELRLPELENKTVKMYRGGRICLSVHFHPLWSRNVPGFGVAHALVLGLAPWLAAEVPHLADSGMIKAFEVHS